MFSGFVELWAVAQLEKLQPSQMSSAGVFMWVYMLPDDLLIQWIWLAPAGPYWPYSVEAVRLHLNVPQRLRFAAALVI